MLYQGGCMVVVLHCRLSRRSKIKAIINLCYVPFRWPQCRALTPPNGSKNKKKKILIHSWWECKSSIITLEGRSGSFLYNEYDLTPTLPVQQSNFFAFFFKGEKHLWPHKKTCTKMFITALLKSAQSWKQQIFLAHEQNSKLWYIRVIGNCYYSWKNRNELARHALCTLLNQRRQCENLYVVLFYCMTL